MPLRRLDFRCSNEECGAEMRDVLSEVEAGAKLSEMAIECPLCDAIARHFWPLGTRFAMKGEENVPKEYLEAARNGIVRTAGGGVVEPFRGSTRSELAAWERRNGLVSMPSDEAMRGNATINSKPKYTESKEFIETLAAKLIEADEIAEAGGDRLAEAKAKVERPNDYDVNSFRQQTEAGLVEGEAVARGASVPIADIAEEIRPTA